MGGNQRDSGTLLNSWKAIASYLGCDERTARRWERDRGLPVHRPPGPRGHVYAYTDELDQWLRSAKPSPAAPVQAGRKAVILAAASLLSLAAAGVAWHFWLRPFRPARAEIVGRSLQVRDEQGRLLWAHGFPDGFRSPEELQRQGSPLRADRAIRIADLDGDGSPEVILRVGYAPDETGLGPEREEICCFSNRGKLLWCYRPEITIRMGDTAFDGPWRFTDMILEATGRSQAIWAAAVHSHWRPAFVVRLDASGRAALRFIHAGWIYALHVVRHREGSRILAGGVNNEYAAASLAVLRGDAEPACSPQTPGSRFACSGEFRGSPERYFLFPPSELSRLVIPYNAVQGLEPAGGGVLLTTSETEDGVWAFYRFSEELEPVNVAFNYRFGILHRRFEQRKLLGHPVEGCPQLGQPVKLRRWDPRSGWTTITVPPAPGVRPDVWPADSPAPEALQRAP